MRCHVRHFRVNVEMRSVLTLVDMVSNQNDPKWYFFVKNRDKTAVLPCCFLGFSAHPLEFFLGVFRDDVTKLGLDSFPQMVVVVLVDFLDFDEIIKHLVTVYDLQTV